MTSTRVSATITRMPFQAGAAPRRRLPSLTGWRSSLGSPSPHCLASTSATSVACQASRALSLPSPLASTVVTVVTISLRTKRRACLRTSMRRLPGHTVATLLPVLPLRTAPWLVQVWMPMEPLTVTCLEQCTTPVTSLAAPCRWHTKTLVSHPRVVRRCPRMHMLTPLKRCGGSPERHQRWLLSDRRVPPSWRPAIPAVQQPVPTNLPLDVRSLVVSYASPR